MFTNFCGTKVRTSQHVQSLHPDRPGQNANCRYHRILHPMDFVPEHTQLKGSVMPGGSGSG